MASESFVVNSDGSATLNGHQVETQDNKGQPNGYPGLNGNGDLLGRWFPRSGTDNAMAVLTGDQGELTLSTDTGTLRVHDGTTPGGKPGGVVNFTFDIKNFPGAGILGIPPAASTSFAPGIGITVTDTRTTDKELPWALVLGNPKYVGQRLTVYVNRTGNDSLPTFALQGTNLVFGEQYLDQPTLAAYTLDGTGGYTTATGRALVTGPTSHSFAASYKILAFDFVAVRYLAGDAATVPVLSWLVTGTTVDRVEAANWVIDNYATV